MFFFYPPGCFDGLAARGTLRSQELATCTFLQQKSFQLKRFWAEPLGPKVEGHMHASGPILFRKVVSVLNKRNLGTHLLYVCYVYIHTLHAYIYIYTHSRWQDLRADRACHMVKVVEPSKKFDEMR